MIKRLINNIFYGAIVSIPIIVLGLVIAYVVLADKNKLDLTLFILGAIPVVIFLPSLFSKSHSGALHTPKVIFRKVDTLKKREHPNLNDNKGKSNLLSPSTLVIAGVITWLVGVTI
jgi:hypothetical protein